MDEKKFLNLTGLSSFLANLKKIFATAAQGTKADEAYTHAESAHAPSNAERNVIIGIKKNGSDLTPDSSRKVNITVPTKVSELANDSGYKTTDTTYSTGTASVSGITKLYTGTGTATDGTMTQNAITSALNGKAASSHTHNYAGSSSAGGAANSVKTSLVVKLNGGSTEGTNMFTFNGATAKSVNITPSSIGAATSNHTHSGYAASSHNHSAANITSGTLPIARGGTGGTSAASARLQLGAVNIVCSEIEPTGQNVGDIWLQEL